jgi:hypothetical protein
MSANHRSGHQSYASPKGFQPPPHPHPGIATMPCPVPRSRYAAKEFSRYSERRVSVVADGQNERLPQLATELTGVSREAEVPAS